ncbi:cytochrome P450, partial [Cynara cardunculus var. scolymus]
FPPPPSSLPTLIAPYPPPHSAVTSPPSSLAPPPSSIIARTFSFLSRSSHLLPQPIRSPYLGTKKMEVSISTVMGVGLVLLLLILTLALLHASAFPKEMDGILGSFGWPFVGESFPLYLNFQVIFMNKRQQRYGKVFKSYVLGRYIVFTTGREASKMLLTGKYGMVSLNLFYTGQKNGEDHKRLRRLIAEPLSIDGLKLS